MSAAIEETGRPRRRSWLQYVPDASLILALSAWLYVPATGQPFVSDDYAYLQLVQERTGLAGLLLTPSPFHYFRPLVHLAFAFDLARGGLHPSTFHLTNLALHLAFTMLLVPALAWCAPEGTWTRRAALLLFLSHPFHSSTVVWITARADLLCSIFLLSALIAHFGAGAGRRGPVRWFAALALHGAALGSKELAMIMPLLVFALELARSEPSAREARAARIAAVSAVPYALLAGTFFVLRWNLLDLSGRLGDSHAPLRFAPNLLLSLVYGFVPVEPFDLSLATGHPLAAGAIAILVLAAIAAGAFLVLRTFPADRPLRLASATMLSGLVLATGVETWRYYLPSAGIALVIARLAELVVGRLLPRSALLDPDQPRSRDRASKVPTARTISAAGTAGSRGVHAWASLAVALVAGAWLMIAQGRIADMASAAETSERAVAGILEAARSHPGRPLLIVNAPYVFRGAPLWPNPSAAASVRGAGPVEAVTLNYLALSKSLIQPEWSVEGPGAVRVRADPRLGLRDVGAASIAGGNEPITAGYATIRVLSRDRARRPVEILYEVDPALVLRDPVALAWSPAGLRTFDLRAPAHHRTAPGPRP